jgi:hypothetical protein
MQFKRIATLACVLAVASGAAFAGVNSKELGAVLIYPTYQAYSGDDIDTYITLTNDKNLPVRAHFEVISGRDCDGCSFNVELTPYETQRLWFNREQITEGGSYATFIRDASQHSFSLPNPPPVIAACNDSEGFVVVSLEDPNLIDAATLGENMLHGDLVIVHLEDGTSAQMGAIAIQAAGDNDGNRVLEFDGVEYARFPSIVTGNFWAPNIALETELILFNVGFQVGQVPEPVTICDINYVNAYEFQLDTDYDFDCYSRVQLEEIAVNFHENVLGTANGFLWARCDAGTHGALLTELDGTTDLYPYPVEQEPGVGAHADTLFQSITLANPAVLDMTPYVPDNE